MFKLATDAPAPVPAVEAEAAAPVLPNLVAEVMKENNNAIMVGLRVMMQATHLTAIEHGWLNDDIQRDPLVLLALVTSEVGEAIEACRSPILSSHIPGFTMLEEELADILIRVVQMGQEKKLRLAEATIAKMVFNNGRPYRHGGKAY